MIILGGGRVGTALTQRAQALEVVGFSLVTRTDNRRVLDAPAGEPILVCVREDDLDAVLDEVPAARHPDLVFIQNGMLDDFLAARGLQGCSRGLLYFAVPTRGADLTLGSASPFAGPHAAAVVSALQTLEVPAVLVDREAFTAQMLEKLIWNCSFGLLCQVYGLTVGEICDQHRATLASLVDELARVGQMALGVELARQPLLDRLCAYSSTIADYRGAVKAWTWRNGWFVEAAQREDLDTPVHLAMLRRVGQGGQY